MFMYALIVEIVLLAIIHIHVYVKTYNSHDRKCHYYLRYKRTEMPQLKTGNATKEYICHICNICKFRDCQYICLIHIICKFRNCQ